ncbi:MAG: hypothetical protein AAB708_01865, partial [Patescibacteria group bacterium]
MQKLRPFIFWLFCGLFFLTVTSVILYAFGYRFSLDRGIFIYTGSVTIKANPQDIQISVDNEVVPKKRLGLLNNSFHIAGLTPGEHFIEVTAPSYNTWQKKVVVESGRSTEFWNVLLSKNDPALETLPKTAFATRLFPSPRNNEMAIVKKNGTELTVDITDTRDGSGEQIFSLQNADLLPEGEGNIEWSPDGSFLLIPLLENKEYRYFLVDRKTKEAKLLDVLNQNTNTSKYPRWDPAARDFLFYINGQALFHIDTVNPLAPPLLTKENIRAYDISSSSIYYLSQENGIVYRAPADNQESGAIQITTEPIALDPDGTYTLIVYDEKRLALFERKKGQLFVFNNAAETGPVGLKELLPSGVKGMQFSDDGKKLLYFTDNEISTYFLREWEVQPIREPDTTTQIARFSTPIKNVQWTKDYEHVLFSLNGNVKIIELDNRDRRNLLDLITFPTPVTQVVS